MRKTLPPEIESQRVAGDPDSGPLGAFKVLCPVMHRRLLVVASDGRDWGKPQEPPTPAEIAEMPPALRRRAAELFASGPLVLPPPVWEHVSVSSPFGGPPTWAEMCWVKDVFFEEGECAVEYHPPKSDYVNVHKNCLHLWRCPELEFPMPPKACV